MKYERELGYYSDPDNQWNEKIRPDYYKVFDNQDVMDLIDYMNMNFERGSALKYLIRAGRKAGADEKVDLHKAIECLLREIVRLEKNNAKAAP